MSSTESPAVATGERLKGSPIIFSLTEAQRACLLALHARRAALPVTSQAAHTRILNLLEQKGLIERVENQIALTSLGLAFVDSWAG